MKNGTPTNFPGKSGRVILAAALAGVMMVPAGVTTALADTAAQTSADGQQGNLSGWMPGSGTQQGGGQKGGQGGTSSGTVYGVDINPVVTSDTKGAVGTEIIEADATVTFASSGATAAGTNADAVAVDGSTVTIAKAGTYVLTNADPSQRVATKVTVDLSNATKGAVKLVLNGVNITASSDVSTAEDDDAVITIAKKNVTDTTVYLAAGSANVIDTGAIANTTISEDDVYYPVGIICKKNDLTLDGAGSLLLNSANGSGIKCTANLTLDNGNVQVYAGGKNGLSGKTGVTVNGGTYDIQAENDCLKATYDLADLQDDDEGATYASYREAGKDIDGDVTINGGTLSLASHAGDGIQAYDNLTVNGGNITVKGCIEGIEGAVVTVKDGNIRVVSTDDGFNASGDDESSKYYALSYEGGTTTVIASNADGLDSNGYIYVSGGTLNVFSPANLSGNSPLDSEFGIVVTGGTLAASGPGLGSSMGGGSTPSGATTQCWANVNFSSAQAAGTVVTVKDSQGSTCMTVAPENSFYGVVLSDPSFVAGSTYTVSAGDTQVGTFTASTSGSSTGGSSQGGGQGGTRPGGQGGTQPGGQGGTQPTQPSGGDQPTPPSGDDPSVETTHTAADPVKENVVVATCTEEGSYDSVVYCKTCGAEISRETVKVPATGHTVVLDAPVAATYTSMGLTAGSHCSVCGKILVAQEVVPALSKMTQPAQVKTSKVVAKGLKKGKLKATKTFAIAKSGVEENAACIFSLASSAKAAKKYVAVSKAGKITVKKGLKKGAYKIKVKMVLAQTESYQATNVSKTIKVVVK